MKKLQNLAFLAVVIFAGAMAQSCSDDVAQFLGIKVDAAVNNLYAGDLSGQLGNNCGMGCDGDPDNDTMIKSWSVYGTDSASITIDGHECNYDPGMMVDADAIQAGLIAAVNGEDSDCGPDNTHTVASAGSLLVEGLFGGWSFATSYSGGLESEMVEQEPGRDAYALARLLTWFGMDAGRWATADLFAQAVTEDSWPDAGPYAYFAQETANCNRADLMTEGDDSAGTATVTTAVHGEVLAAMASIKESPNNQTPSDTTIDGVTYIVTYHNCEVTGNFWGDATEETVTLNGTTTLRVSYDPALQGTTIATDEQETADMSGVVTAAVDGDTGVMVINAKDVGWDTDGDRDGGFCMNGGSVVFGDVDTDGLDDSCLSGGTFIPYSFMFGIPDLDVTP
ncbi:MAG: hypothetical protein KDH09_08060 [Chrysiogenetes bacterium]|nr:hypothetical protein [Chrysiogenetes bacterium]